MSSFRIDTTAPTLSQVTAVSTPTGDNTPDYTFNSNEAGAITYGGACSSSDNSSSVGHNTVTFNELADGTYDNCTITVTDSLGHTSSALGVSAFTVDTTAPTLLQVMAVTTPTKDTTPSYVFASPEVGTISYGGNCSSSTKSATLGLNTITFNTLSDAIYSNCTITVTDTAGNVSSPLGVNTFVVDTKTALVWDEGYWDFHKWQ